MQQPPFAHFSPISSRKQVLKCNEMHREKLTTARASLCSDIIGILISLSHIYPIMQCVSPSSFCALKAFLVSSMSLGSAVGIWMHSILLSQRNNCSGGFHSYYSAIIITRDFYKLTEELKPTRLSSSDAAFVASRWHSWKIFCASTTDIYVSCGVHCSLIELKLIRRMRTKQFLRE